MNRLTKIVATIGPACESPEMITKMIEAGVNVFRFNFKHNTTEWHDMMIERVNQVARKMKVRIGTLIDLQGPEIRINMPVDQIEIFEGDLLLLGPSVFENGEKGFSISHPDIIPHLTEGQDIVADDGAFKFSLVKKEEKTYLLCESNGILKNRKTLNIPGADFPFPVMIERDFEGLKLAERKDVDYIALSFVRTEDDLKVMRQEMERFGVKAQVVSKIETEKALNHLCEIIEASDGVMVARGDLGVELSVEKVPYFQKMIIKKAIEKGKFVITATQMLESMIKSPFPTRAEVSDVANATYDLTDAVMLSGESASGEYPVQAVTMMRRTIDYNEKKFNEDTRLKYELENKDTVGMVCNSAYDLYLKMEKTGDKVKAFLILTETGRTARLMSLFRPNIPIYTFSPNSETADSLMINYGIYPFAKGKRYKKNMAVTKNHVHAAVKYLAEKEVVKAGDKLIVLHGDMWGNVGSTSTVKLVEA